jgi:hypothetical protein
MEMNVSFTLLVFYSGERFTGTNLKIGSEGPRAFTDILDL